MLVLFDIDATILTTSRAGVRAMGEAGRELFGAHFDESRVEYSGRLDPLIIGDLLSVHDLPCAHEDVERFRRAYGRHLRALLTRHPTARPCPGVARLLQELSANERITLGLLTGNYPDTGKVKLRAAGIDSGLFELRVWGNDSPHSPPAREHLTGVAIERFAALRGESIDGSSVTIVGDTPHDAACARAHGCRSLGVATGMFSCAELDEAGADIAVEDLSATAEITRWLLEGLQAGEASNQTSEA